MEQKQGAIHYGIESSTSSSSTNSLNNKEVSELQKDFSVTNRLLSHYNETKDSSKSHNTDVYTSCYPHGWQYLLPTDQGSVSASRSGWQGMVPNATLPRTQYELQNFKADVSSPFASASGYSLVQHHNTQKPNGEHVAQLPGSTTPLHHATNVKEISPTSPDCDLQNKIPDTGTRSSSTGTSRHTSRSRSGTEEPGDEFESENLSGDETDGESSTLSHSSHGGSAYIDEPKKPKRTRTAYSNNQLDQLELVFSQTQYPDVFLREELAKNLGIKEDRIQVWFQNRRARFRKQERTGSVSFRSRYRQRRLQKVLQQSQAMSSVYPGYMSSSQNTPSTMLLPSPQPMATYMSNFPFPAQIPAVSTGMAPNSSTEPITPSSTAGYLPGFHTLRPASMPLPNYVSRALPNGSRPPYTPLHTGGIAPATGQKS